MFSEARTRPRHCSAGRTQEGANTARRTVAARSGLRSTGGADGMGARRPSDSMAASKQSISAPVSSGVNMNTAQSGSANSHSIRRARRYCASSVPVYPQAFGATVIFSGSSPQSANPLSRRADFSPARRRAQRSSLSGYPAARYAFVLSSDCRIR